MEFQNTQPIFMQIVDVICDRVLQGKLKTDEQIPSVRDLSVQMQVNPNTVQRAIERLLQKEIIYSLRGRGNYLAEGAVDKIREMRSKRFYEEQLPRIVNEMKLLSISLEEISEKIEEILQQNR
ncbi:MAG: GntR family transcriptional regulator [Bacteroidales bacterium]|nr:GntR family transcriptional regulator [Bacteroidales bacterium]